MSDGNDVLKFQLAMIEKEVDVVNETIRQMDDISKSLKEWAITVWAAGLGGALITGEFRPYSSIVACIPALFWIVDTYHHVVQRKFIWRGLQIMDFLNDDRLHKSFESGKLVGFTVMDLGSRRERGDDYRKFTSFFSVMLFKTQSILYIGLIGAALVAGIAVPLIIPSN